jgi:hypothetical protein
MNIRQKAEEQDGGNYIMKNFIVFAFNTSLSAPVNLSLLFPATSVWDFCSPSAL